MTDREKLIELSKTLLNSWAVSPESVADFFLSNGVMLRAEAKLYWKSVDIRTSELTCSACETHLGCSEDAKYCPSCGAKFVINEVKLPKECE